VRAKYCTNYNKNWFKIGLNRKKNVFVANLSGIWQPSTQKTALTVKMRFFKVSSERVKQRLNSKPIEVWKVGAV